MKLFNPQVLSKILYDSPNRANKTIKQTAQQMGGIDERYLSRQLNPDDPGAKLGVEDFVYLTAVTDTEALDYIEQAFNRVAVQIPTQCQAHDARWFKHIASITKETGECVCTLADALADGELTRRELNHCIKETYDAIQALASLWVKLKDITPVRLPG